MSEQRERGAACTHDYVTSEVHGDQWRAVCFICGVPQGDFRVVPDLRNTPPDYPRYNQQVRVMEALSIGRPFFCEHGTPIDPEIGPLCLKCDPYPDPRDTLLDQMAEALEGVARTVEEFAPPLAAFDDPMDEARAALSAYRTHKEARHGS